MTVSYTVVENAGYEGERDVTTYHANTSHGACGAYTLAERFIKRWYRKSEIESLHVAIRKDMPEGGTYEY